MTLLCLSTIVTKRMRLHDLRHAHATFLVAAGVDIRTVADHLGHADAAFTLRTYSHSDDTRDREAALIRLRATSITWDAMPAADVIGKFNEDGKLRAPTEIEEIRIQCLLAGLGSQYNKITSLNRETAARLIHARETSSPIEDCSDIRERMRVALLETRHEASLSLEARNTLISSIIPGPATSWKRRRRDSK